MHETNISFYLKCYRIHVFVDALRGIGSPKRICFMMSENGDSLMVAPYEKRDLKSHSVPSAVYAGSGGMEINSYKLCRLIAGMQGWDLERSYRIPGVVYTNQQAVVFDLRKAEVISLSGTDSER